MKGFTESQYILGLLGNITVIIRFIQCNQVPRKNDGDGRTKIILDVLDANVR